VRIRNDVRQWVRWFVLNGATVARLAAATVGRQQWAERLVKFAVWPLRLFCLFAHCLFWVARIAVHIDDNTEGKPLFPLESIVSKITERVVPAWWDRSFDLLVTAFMAGMGWYVTASAYLCHTVLIILILSSQRKLQEKHHTRIEKALGVKL